MEFKSQIEWQDYVRIFFHRKMFFFTPLILLFVVSVRHSQIIALGIENAGFFVSFDRK